MIDGCGILAWIVILDFRFVRVSRNFKKKFFAYHQLDRGTARGCFVAPQSLCSTKLLPRGSRRNPGAMACAWLLIHIIQTH